ncbi:TPA: sensor domain-containing diguanylate cyclase [Klebsiella michiganensis]|jgi:diguanylate cyclase|uniref:sensor domain-containing diguanylate cyclase n=1 Tax=Klebsiella michiganensis TaxID=1134687 RepID=UPI0007CC09D4|nr:sensor domain-containing diguanylate cyclase [Klebsiella michiganensis]EKV5144282.1 sensor domain-containing diguanylate cyclase [Klebsiella michiganensis]MBA4427164.1 sensor domain-containing diguanylate cyclase [Klebsiella michiganensis]MBW5963296.1 GGDEF domain-containing protein [Klebsiella michiganensis]MBZ7624997.1 sensor domain-containing diguanylate cyclase [Klebsiella michiganensis]MCW9449455.1 sensor domain-containing diguanylate cyclase [Klebsiella michiganensis]
MSDFILARVSQTLANEHSLETLVRQLLEMLELVTRMESTYLTRIDFDAQRQHIMYAHNSSEMQIPEGFSVPWNDSLCKRALDDRCIFSNDVAERWRSCLAAQDLGIATFFSIPVRLTDGSLFGTLCATSRARQPYNIEGEQVMNLFANLISHYVEKETLVQQLRAANVALEMHSYTDELTGLPNRRSLFKHLAAQFSQAREQQRSVLLIFIDLDDFKAINDRFGHPCGDSFLIQIGERLAARVRSSDIVGRLGGDEFLIVGPGPDSADQQEYIAALRQALAGIYFLGEHRINYPGASFGVIEADPWQIDVELALRAADEAMYQDKQSRRQGRFFHID